MVEQVQGPAEVVAADAGAKRDGVAIGRWVGAGIGSAALAAALLYATRAKQNLRKK